MKSKNLSDLSLSELMEKEKELKKVSNIMMAVLILSPIIVVGLLFQKQFGTVCFVLIFCVFVPLYLLQLNKKQLSDIKTELEKGEQQKSN